MHDGALVVRVDEWDWYPVHTSGRLPLTGRASRRWLRSRRSPGSVRRDQPGRAAATCRLDMHLVQAAVGDPHVRLATEQELLRDFPGIELGALPPLGSLLGAPLYVDQEVLQHETVVFAAGSQTESVQIRTADLLQHEQVTALPLIRHADENDKDWRR